MLISRESGEIRGIRWRIPGGSIRCTGATLLAFFPVKDLQILMIFKGRPKGRARGAWGGPKRSKATSKPPQSHPKARIQASQLAGLAQEGPAGQLARRQSSRPALRSSNKTVNWLKRDSRKADRPISGANPRLSGSLYGPFIFSSSFVLGSLWEAQKIERGRGGGGAEGGRARNTYILKKT